MNPPPETIQFTDIIEGDRARNLKKYGDLKGLCASLSSLGTIQPIVLSRRPDGKYDLVAGGRRYRAIKKLEVTTLHHGVTLDPTRLGYIYASEVPEDVRKEAELDENLHRLDMDWIDSCLLVCDVHETKKKSQTKGWGVRQTAALLGKGYGAANVSYAIRIGKLLRTGDKEMLKQTSMSDAIGLMIKRAEDGALAELQKRATDQATKQPKASLSSFLDTINIQTAKKGGDEKCELVNKQLIAPVVAHGTAETTDLPVTSPAAERSNPSPAAHVEKAVVPLSQMFLLGDGIKPSPDYPRGVLGEMPNSSFDHIVTDIPYGIDMENLDAKQVEDVAAEHDVVSNVELMPLFLQHAFRLLRPRGFCVFFYDLDHHEKLQTFARSAGFRVQRWPYIAVKTSSCQNNAAQYNTTKNYEVAMFLRKDSETVLRRPQTTSWKTYDFASERKLYNNPFAKPFDLWKDIYDAIAFQGQTVLDPFCGECSSSRAAVNCGLVPFGVEINPKHFNRGMEVMRKVYALVHKSNVSFT